MRWKALLSALVMVVALAGCGSDEKAARVKTVAIVTPGSGNDLDWTRQAREAFRAIVNKRRLSSSTAESVTARQVPSTLERLCRAGVELVFMQEPSYAALAARAAENSKLPVLVWGDRGAVRPGLVGDVEIAAAEGGYVAGALSSHATGIKNVAVLIAEEGTAWDATNWNRMAGGFIAGARHEAPNVKVTVRWIGEPTGATPLAMKHAATRLLRQNVQTIFVLGGPSAIGVLRAIDRTTGEQEYTGVIGDKATVNRLSDVVTSVLYNFDEIFRRAIVDMRKGTFGDRPYVLSYANGGLRLLKTGRTPQDAYDSALKTAAEIKRGSIALPETPTRADVRALLRARSG